MIKQKFQHIIGFALTGILFLSCSQNSYSQANWVKIGLQDDKYIIGIDSSVQYEGQQVMTVNSIDAQINGFGGIKQNVTADKYLGKRIRMTGYMKTYNVIEKAAFWLRIDQAGSKMYVLDNMNDRPIKGTTDWKKYEIVLDVPPEALSFAYGAMLHNAGQIWFAKIKFEIVDNTVPLTIEKLISPAQIIDARSNWKKGGNQPDKYEVKIDSTVKFEGQNVMTIRSLEEELYGYGTASQSFIPDPYRGKRLRMSGYIRSKDVEVYAGFWMMVDKPESANPSGVMDNMARRPIKGTVDWKKYEIVIDVPQDASNIFYGSLLSNTGQIWFAKIKFEIVDNTVPLTIEKVKY